MLKINKTPEYFLTVASERSISRAAEKLFISQPYLSQHISRLEEQFGVKLFDRRKTPLELTEAGKIYRNYLESSNYLYQKMCADLDMLSSDRNHELHIGIGTWRGSLLAPAIFPAFLDKHPNVRVNLHEHPISELTSLLRSEAIDFAVMNTAVNSMSTDISIEVIAHERIFLVLKRSLPAAEALLRLPKAEVGSNLHLLADTHLIALDRNLTVGSHVDNFLARNYINFPHRLNTTNNATAIELAAKGLGFCFLVESGLADLSRYDDLVALDLHSRDLMIPLSIVRKRERFFSLPEQELCDLIRKYYRSLLAEEQT